MKPLFALLFLFCSLACSAQLTSRNFAVELQKTSDSYPFGFSWKPDPLAKSRVIHYKHPDSIVWHLLDSSSASNGSSFIDSSLFEGERRDYSVKEYRFNFEAYGYISLGHHYKTQQKKRRLLLLIDSNYQIPLQDEIQELEEDISSENWEIIKRYCGRTEALTDIKSWIYSSYTSDTTQEYYVYLLGRIPIPYSGVLVPDGHYPGHFGAWPSDIYYVNFDTIWTDSLMDYSIATDPRNHNIPGDGKFDPWEVNHNKAKISIGRVDLTNMPAFGNDTFLIKRYLEKAHLFRKANVNFEARAIIDDNFGAFGGEAFAAGGWRNFSTLLGDSVFVGDYRTSLSQGSYLFSYGCGGGSYTSAGGIGTSNDFVNDSLANPFTLVFGSYFGDWDNKNNYLRAPLASKGWGLSNVWSGRPTWLFHHSALGDPIGRSSLESQKADSSVYFVGYGDAFVHAAFMGDPTLPVYPLGQGKDLIAIANCSEEKIRLEWQKAQTWDSVEILTRANNGDLIILNTLLADSQSFESNFTAGTHQFFIRGKNLKYTPSGSFYQYSSWLSTEVLLNPKTQVTFNYTSDSLCFGDSIQISDASQGPINWSSKWTLNGIPIGSFNDSTLRIDNPGFHRVVLEVINDSFCVSIDSFSFHISEALEAKFQFDKSHYCFGDTIWMLPLAPSNKHLWNYNSNLLSEDSIAIQVKQEEGYYAFEHISFNPLGCSKAYIDSTFLSGPILKSSGLSPFNHSICVDSDQDKAQSFIETHKESYLELWLDNQLIDSVNLEGNFYSSTHQFSIAGNYHLEIKAIDSLSCIETESYDFDVFPKAPLPMALDSIEIISRVAAEVHAIYFPKAHYYWGGYCDNSQTDSAHKRWYGCGMEQDGNYPQWVVLEDSNECISDTAYFQILLRTSIENLKSRNFEVFPNPGNGIINWSGDFAIIQLNIYSIEGKLLMNRKIEFNQKESRLDLEAGTYILDFIDDEGRHIAKKIIIK